jgi:hypothetical protein
MPRADRKSQKKGSIRHYSFVIRAAVGNAAIVGPLFVVSSGRADRVVDGGDDVVAVAAGRCCIRPIMGRLSKDSTAIYHVIWSTEYSNEQRRIDTYRYDRLDID